GDALRQRRSFYQLPHLARVVGLLHAVNCGVIRMVQRGQYLCLTPEARHAFGVSRAHVGQDLQRHVTSLRRSALHCNAWWAGLIQRLEWTSATGTRRELKRSYWQVPDESLPALRRPNRAGGRAGGSGRARRGRSAAGFHRPQETTPETREVAGGP